MLSAKILFYSIFLQFLPVVLVKKFLIINFAFFDREQVCKSVKMQSEDFGCTEGVLRKLKLFKFRAYKLSELSYFFIQTTRRCADNDRIAFLKILQKVEVINNKNITEERDVPSTVGRQPFHRLRRGARVAEEARLESVCAPKAYRGFESLSLRENLMLNFEGMNFKFFISVSFHNPKFCTQN